MSRIGEMPDVDEIQNNGFLIYSDDGLYAKKITVEDFATAMGILMTNDSEVGGETGAGLVGWKEYAWHVTDGTNVRGRQNLPKVVYALAGEWTNANDYVCGLASLYPFTAGMDIWKSRFQKDDYEHANAAPALDDIIESRILLGTEEATGAPQYLYRPYSLFSLVHPLGYSLDDYTRVDSTTYKILTDDIDRYKADIFVAFPTVSSQADLVYDDTYDQTINLGEGVTRINNRLTAFNFDNGISFDIYRYRLNDIYNSVEDCEEAIAEIFDSNTSAPMAGYYSEGILIKNLAKYLDTTEHEDSDEYTYIKYRNDQEYEVQYSEQGDKYTDYLAREDVHGGPSGYDAFASMLFDVMQPEIRGGFTALTTLGIYINFPFNRVMVSEGTDKKYDWYEGSINYLIKYSQVHYDIYDIEFKERMDHRLTDYIYTGYQLGATGRQPYSKQLLDYFRREGLVTDNFITDVYLGDFPISEDGVATIRPGFGLKAVVNNGKAYLAVDDTQVQRALTAGHGIAIENNTIRVIPDIYDVVIGNQSVVTNKVARITLPTGLNETRLEDGDYTEIEQVSQGNGYATYKVNVKGLENEIIQTSGTYIYGPGNTTFKLMTITIPAKSSGILNYSICANSGNNANPNNFFVASDVFETDSPTFNNPGVNALASFTHLGEPYTLAQNTQDARAFLKATGTIVNDTYVNKNYYIYCMITGNIRTEFYGEAQFIKDIDV
jgi:hypothetical protein